MATPLQRLRDLGQSVWLDGLRRSALPGDGPLARLVSDGELDGVTASAAALGQALGSDEAYGPQLAELAGTEPHEALWALLMRDVQQASDLFLPLYEASQGTRGFVSVESDPAKAFDTEETVAEALVLYRELDRPNVMLTVPATEPGLAAVTRLLTEGVNVNVTWLFDVARYEAAVEAYRKGLRAYADAGGDVRDITSVASFAVSQLDAKVDAQLGETHAQLATAGIANARLAYETFQHAFASPDFAELRDAGARAQFPLWASGAVTNPALPDTVYLDELAGPDSVASVPQEIFDVYRQRGNPEDRLTGSGGEARHQLERLAEAGVDLPQAAKELEVDSIEAAAAEFDTAVQTVAGYLR